MQSCYTYSLFILRHSQGGRESLNKTLFLCNYTHKLSSFKLYFSALTEFSYFEAKALIGQLHDDVIY